jgi:bifunctional non-homologous end joining protein LigD
MPSKKYKRPMSRKTAMPSSIEPMLCTLIREPFQDKEYIYEPKLDGYRIICFKSGKKVRLNSRSGLDYTSRYPSLEKAIRALPNDFVLDGEVVVLNKKGRPDFDALQVFNGDLESIAYFIFDLLWIDGYNIMHLPLLERKELLAVLLKGNKLLKYTSHVNNGLNLFDKMLKSGMEGIVAKRKDSSYIPGDRSSNWYKTPAMIRQEFVIGGWAESDKARLFKSLLFGAYNKQHQLEWIGRSGGGYKEKEMPEILKQLQSIEIKTSPFINPVLDSKGAKMHFVKPRLVGNFSFATWTKSGRIRKPATFLGFRSDKRPGQVVREIPEDLDMPIKSAKKKANKKKT